MASTIKNILYFDIETKHLSHEVGGWDNISQMGISVVTSYDSGTGQFYSFEESNIAELIDEILNAGLVVGFNQLRFDYRVLSAYSDADFWSVPSFDMLVAVTATLGHRLKLDHIVQATLNAKKTGDGTQAINWFRNGEIERVKEYCMNDTKITRGIFTYGCRKGHLLYLETQHAHRPTSRVDTSHWRDTVKYVAAIASGLKAEPNQATANYLKVMKNGV